MSEPRPDALPPAPLDPAPGEDATATDGAVPTGDAIPTGVVAPAPTPSSPAIREVSARRLIGASFDLLTHSGEDMRRASFYIGAVVLGTIGPLALGLWGFEVIALDRSVEELAGISERGADAAFAALALLALCGLLVVLVESRTLAVAVLGGRMAGRPVGTRQALARARQTFWRAAIGSILVAIPVGIAQGIASAVLAPLVSGSAEIGLVATFAVAVVVGAPFAYVLSGIVLGDVDPFESLRRSIRLFRARKIAAAVVVGFEIAAVLLIFLGISAGLDLVLRVFTSLGLGPDAGPVGLGLTTAGVIAVVFAGGTLIYTVIAITVAPQVVMFVGLTHATIGLDRVRPGGSDDPDSTRPGHRRFRWLTRPLLLGFALGGLGLATLLALLTG